MDDHGPVDQATLKRAWEKTLPTTADADALPPGKTYKPPTATGIPAADLPTVRAPGPSPQAETVLAAPPETPTPDTTVTPAIDLIKEIGRGGMGIIYRARQGSLRREIAVKQILPGTSDARSESLFVSEALVTGMLEHPNIVPVHELARTGGGEVLLAMKLVSGTSWKCLLHPQTAEEKARAAEFDTPKHLAILLSVGHAVAFAHSRGLVHRDLKPENVMVGEFGEVLVMDWGLAVDVRESPSDARAPHKSAITAPAGTPCYMPPELAEGRGSDIGPWTDTYLLGAILHEIVTGRPPHDGRTLYVVLSAAVRSDPPVFDAGVPEELQRIARKALARLPADRFQSVRDFQQAIEGFLRHRESMVITERAEALLETAATRAKAGGAGERNRTYADFAEAIAGFRQAVVLWDGNERAKSAEHRARVAYASVAVEAGDLGLAEAQAAELEARETVGVGDLRAKIAAARAARERAARSARVMRRGLIGATALIIVGLAVGFLLVRAEQQRTADERDKAVVARKAEAEQRTVAESREREARLNEWKARLETSVGLIARALPLAHEGRQQSAAALLLRAVEVAPRNLRPADWVAAPGQPGWAEPAWTSYRYLSWKLQDLRPVRRFDGHADWVGCVAFSPDGTKLLSGDADGTVILWDVATGKVVRRIEHLDSLATALAFSPDGATAVTTTLGGNVRLWDLSEGKMLREFAASGYWAHVAAFCPDGKAVLAGSALGVVSMWDVGTGKELARLEGHAADVKALNVREDGRFVLTGDQEGTVKLWDLESEKKEMTEVLYPDVAVRSLVFTLAGTGIFCVTSDGCVREWDFAEGREAKRFGGEEQIIGPGAFSPERERVLAPSSDNTLRLWWSRVGRTVCRFEGHADNGTCVAISPDGTRGASGSLDHSLMLWALEPREEVRPFGGHTSLVRVVDFSRDGRTVLTGSDDRTIRIWDPETGKERCRLAAPAEISWSGALSPDGRVALCGQGEGILRLYDVATGAETGRLEGHTAWVTGADFSPDGKQAVSGSWDGTIRLWDVEKRSEVLRFEGVTGRVDDVAFCPDGRSVAGASQDNTIRIWDARTGREIRRLEGHTGAVHDLAFGPDGLHLLSGSEDHTVRLWDTSTGRELRRFDLGSDVACVAFGPDGKVVFGGAGSAGGKLWEVTTGSELRSFSWRQLNLTCAAFDPSGLRLVTGSGEGTVASWSLVAADVPAEPPSAHPGDPNPWREFEPLYKFIGMRVVREGPNQGAIEPVR